MGIFDSSKTIVAKTAEGLGTFVAIALQLPWSVLLVLDLAPASAKSYRIPN